MSLINDPDYLTHMLRLAYLRHVDDPYGARVISLDPRYSYNPHINAAGLADQEKWPELAMPSSPRPMEDNDRDRDRDRDRRVSTENAGIWPGATGLKYSQTIRGPKADLAAGMSVTGRRYSGSRASLLAINTLPDSKLQRLRADSAPTPVSTSPKPHISVHVTAGSPESLEDDANALSRRGGSSSSNIAGKDEKKLEIPFAQFARGAEMEARRLQRIRARYSTRNALPDGYHVRAETMPSLASDTIPENPETDEEEEDEEEEDDDDDTMTLDGDQDDAEDLQDDEFEGNDFLSPGFVPPSATSNGSEVTSLLSGSTSAISASKSFESSLQAGTSSRTKNRLSPVSEAQGTSAVPGQQVAAKTSAPNLSTEATRRSGRSGSGSHAETLTAQHRTHSEPLQHRSPGPANKGDVPPMETLDPKDSTPRHHPRHRHALTTKASIPNFTRRKVLPISQQRPQVSALSKMLASQSSSSSNNPFTELYAAISGRADPSSSINLRIYFPHSRTHKSKSLELKVRKDASAEEVIGFGLWSYWDNGCEPKLDEGLGGEDDPKREVRLGAIGWNLRIVEDDGEVDEDFPALDRTRPISKFSFTEFAICQATAGQVQQNKAIEAKIVRRPSRLMVSKPSRPSELTVAPSNTNLSTSKVSTSALTSVSSAISNAANSTSPLIFLRVRIAESADASYYSTTINVPLDMYMADVLEIVCRKRRFPTNPKEWVLLLDDMSILIPLDRTVASLQGNWNLVMIKRSLADQLDAGKGKRLGRSTDPNASIFKHGVDGPQDGDTDFTGAYKKYTVHRKVPMLVGRHERVLAIDGDYIHIMPSGNKAFLDSMKTSSYLIKHITNCAQSKSGSAGFKLVVHRDGGNKRYDFEADTPELAAEIVANIKHMQKLLDRSSTVHKSKSRRPRSTATVK